MPEHTLLVGLVLLAIVPFVIWDGVSSLRAGFDNAFWALPMEEKLPRVAEQPKAWRRMATTWIYISMLLTAGLTAFAYQLGAAGEPVLAALGLGAFVATAIAFMVVSLVGIHIAGVAADKRQETGTTPSWLQPVWNAHWVVERVFVVGANLAYVVWGVAMVDSGFPAEWAGWAAFVTGLLIAAWAALQDYFFEHMTLITPLVVGVALVLA